MTLDQYEERIKTCEGCKHFTLGLVLNRLFKICGLCGCVVDKKAKLPDAVCPENKWSKEV